MTRGAVGHTDLAAAFRACVWNTQRLFAIAIRLRDLSRYGMLYTPSWICAAREPVVSSKMLKKIPTSGRSSIYPPGLAQRLAKKVFGGDAPVANSRQWDEVFSDGDFLKLGMHGQGLYISPSKDVVIAWFSTAESTELLDDTFHAWVLTNQ